MCLTAVFVRVVVGRGSVSRVSLLWMTPGLCSGVDGPEMYELLSGSLGVFVGGPVKGDYMSVLMGHMCCLLCLYILPCASM